MRRRVLPVFLVTVGALAVQLAAQRARREPPPRDWPMFGGGPASPSALDAPTGITAENVASLTRHQIRLDGTVDASAIYLRGVEVSGARHDTFFVTTSYGKTIALDADSRAVLWEYTPPGYSSLAGTAQITNSTPAADSDRQSIYAAAPDGTVQKLAIADGHVVWSTAITLLPSREKIASPLKVYSGRVIAVTGGYIGDQPPYQGHVAVLDAQTGAIEHVWNSLCSDRAGLLQPSSCASTRSAIWGRAGAVIDPATGNIFVATGNGPYNGTTDWGDSVVELTPDASRMLGNFTPSDNATLDARDLDLGSSSPMLLGDGILVQGGKGAMFHVLSLDLIAGTAGHTDHEIQSVPTPSQGMLRTAPAVWRRRNGETWMFAADGSGTAAWTVENGRLAQQWSNSNAGTSPLIAGGLLYVYDPNGGLRMYDPASGAAAGGLASGGGHWNSPIVVDGRIALPEGSANAHATSGVLDIWTTAAR